MSLTAGVLVFLAYLLGSIPFGWLLVRRVRGEDIRSKGSGNIGAANVLREAGPTLGLLTLLLDAGKGAFSAWMARRIAGSDSLAAEGAALASVLGHLYPPWLGFRGGKGVATGAGAFGILHPGPMLVAVAVFAAALLLTRRVAAGSMAAAAVYPLGEILWRAEERRVGFAVAASLLILWRHRGNFGRLLHGREPRIGERARRERAAPEEERS